MDNLSTIINRNDALPNVTLNFDALREEGTAYIAQLSNKLWTDFNTHDPGITMLEVLCFAINDLAFRTQFPIGDLLTSTQPFHDRQQFFTAAQILPGCPVTALDYRKLMIDCEGVKNAWLFKAGAEEQSFYRSYYLLKDEEELASLNESIAQIGETFNSSNPFPLVGSFEDFIEILVENNIDVRGCERAMFELFSLKVKALGLREDLSKIDIVLDFLQGLTLESTSDSITLYNTISNGLSTWSLNPVGFSDQIDFIIECIDGEELNETNKADLFEWVGERLDDLYVYNTRNLERLFDENQIEGEERDDLKLFMDSLGSQSGNPTNLFRRGIAVRFIIQQIIPALLSSDAPGSIDLESETLQEDIVSLLFPDGEDDVPDRNPYQQAINFLVKEFTDTDTPGYSENFKTREGLGKISDFLELVLGESSDFILTDSVLGDNPEIAQKIALHQEFRACLVRADLSELKQFLGTLMDLIREQDEEDVFDPCNSVDEVRKWFVTRYTDQNPGQDSSTFATKLEPFLWIFDCNLNGRQITERLRANLDQLIDSLLDLENPNQEMNGHLIGADQLITLIEEANLKGQIKEVLDLIKANNLPAYTLIRGEIFDALQSFFRDLQLASITGPICQENLYERIELHLEEKGITNEEEQKRLRDAFIDSFLCWRIVNCPKEELPNDCLPDSVSLKGLYTVCLDLEDEIDPLDTIRIEEIKAVVMEKLCQYRNLAEDIQRIEIVGVKEICIDLSINAEPNADVNQVQAEVIYRIQDFLSTRPQFYGLQELLDMGKNCGEIFQGVVLENGFLLDEELENAQLRRVIYRSDLHQVIMDVPGVASIECFSVNLCEEADRACVYENDWCLDICQKKQLEADLLLPVGEDGERRAYEATISCKFKPLLKVDASSICIQKDGIRITTDQQDVAEKLSLIRQINRRPPVAPQRDISIPFGEYRDLHQYECIQEDFPLVYRVGRGQLSESFMPARRAKAKQLKGFLTFFDQLLANYLGQLAGFKDMLSVRPNPEDRVLLYKSIKGLDPGIDDLFFEAYQVTEETLNLTAGDLSAEDLHALGQLQNLEPLKEAPFLHQLRLRFGASELDAHKKAIILQASLVSTYYEDRLADILENHRDRFDRRNKILDHLIARFGEQFTDYALSLAEPCAGEPCKENRVRLKDTLVRSKIDFLRSIPMLGRDRSKGFNYKGLDCLHRTALDNSDNMTGVEKRVRKILCLENSGRNRLACTPKLKITKFVDEARKCFYFVIVEDGLDPTNPDTTIYLRGTKEYSLRARGRRELERMNKALLKANMLLESDGEHRYLDLVVEEGTHYLRLQDERGTLAQSLPIAEEEAVDLRAKIIPLIFPDDCISEGFHVLEHILLRPTDKDQLSLDPFKLTPDCKIKDPYSFWVSVIALDQWERFCDDNGGRAFFEQTIRRETPAHIGICFLWLSGEEMYQFENAFLDWLSDLAKQGTDECQVEESRDEMVQIMNELLGKKGAESTPDTQGNCNCN